MQVRGVAAVLLGLVSAAYVGACIGDDPAAVSAPEDAGSDGALPNEAGTNEAAAKDADATDAADAGTCTGRACAGGAVCTNGHCPNDVVQLGGSANAQATCAVLANGTVWCWGENAHGELGVGDKAVRTRATKIAVDGNGATFDHVVEVAMGTQHACARKDDGTAWCWGLGTLGQTGVSVSASQADLTAPVKVGNFTGFTAIRAGGDATCAIDAQKNVVCWGSNDHVLLGHGYGSSGDMTVTSGALQCNAIGYINNLVGNATPTVVAGLGEVVLLTMGDTHACSADALGKIKCWGADDFNQLGDAPNNTANGGAPCAKNVTSVTVDATPTSLGASHKATCALYGAGKPAKCWGGNFEGVLGTGAVSGGAPGVFGASLEATAAAGGLAHLCVLTTSGKVECSGLNDHGALGNAGMNALAPQDVLVGAVPLDGATALAPGAFQTCALRNDHQAWCWGDNTVGAGGRLGDGTSFARVGAVKVAGLPTP
jgi:alpha-tubulin suppressor-like RCC1 family protein